MTPHACNVLMVIENRPAPADPRVWPEALALRDHGFAVSVISPKGATELRESYRYIDGIHVYRYALPTGDSARAYLVEYAVALVMTLWLCLKVWRQRGLDVVHVANPPDVFFPIAWLLRCVGKRFVFDQHDLAPEMFEVLFLKRRPSSPIAQLLHQLLLVCERLTYRAANLVIVTNQTFQRVAMTRGRCPEHKIAIIRNGPNVRTLRLAAPQTELKMGKRFLLVYLGIMGAQDGVDYALRALHVLVRTRGRDDVALALLGTGAQESALRALAHELDLDACVRFTGWVERDEIARYLATADIGLSPDPRNTLNDASTMIKTMEYMAYGKPVVAFDLTETHFSAQGAALYARPNLVEDFADKIAVLLDDDALRQRMGEIGRQRIADTLSWHHSERQLIAAYRQMLGTPSEQ